MALDEVVGLPLDGVEHLVQLAGALKGAAVLVNSPGHRCYRRGPCQAVLHVVAGIEPAARQVQPDVGPVVQARVGPPYHRVVGRQIAAALLRVEVNRLLQRFTVVIRSASRLADKQRQQSYSSKQTCLSRVHQSSSPHSND